MLNYYHRFLPNLSTLLEPLHSLLRKETIWGWGPKQDEAFQKSKRLLKSSNLLVHFDPTKELILSCDASSYGVGAVLSHNMENQDERPLVYASRSLNTAERGYSQVEKESLAIIFGVKKSHQYLYGKQFTIVTDHKPLIGLLNESKAIPTLAAARLQRWALTLAAYQYKIIYKAGNQHGNADALSRLPLPEAPRTEDAPEEVVLLMEHLEQTPVKASQIRVWTRQDPVLSRVTQFILQGWPTQNPEEATCPYWNRRTELSVENGCVLWGTRVVIPPQGRQKVLQELHEAHPGISRMKALARSYIWWPHLDKDLEQECKRCAQCQRSQQTPALAPLHPWEWPGKPWFQLHLDFAGPFLGKMFLIIIDAHSKWMEVHAMNSTTSAATCDKLRQTFACHGLPVLLVTDNAPNFTGREFTEFLRKNGIKHILTSPYHPASNGLAERAVRTFKEGMKKMTHGTSETRLARFLLKYRITPQTTTGVSPAQLLMGRRLRTHLDLMCPNIKEEVQRKQTLQKGNHDYHSKDRDLEVQDHVYTKNFSASQPLWIPGRIQAQTGPLSFQIGLPDGRVLRRHQDHIHRRTDVHESVQGGGEQQCLEGQNPSNISEADGPCTLMSPSRSSRREDTEPELSRPEENEAVEEHHYSKHTRRPQEYLKDYVRVIT